MDDNGDGKLARLPGLKHCKYWHKVQSTLHNCVDKTELRSWSVCLEGKAAVQRDLEQTEEMGWQQPHDSSMGVLVCKELNVKQ